MRLISNLLSLNITTKEVFDCYAIETSQSLSDLYVKLVKMTGFAYFLRVCTDDIIGVVLIL